MSLEKEIKLGVVEGWGTGLKKIIDTCKELKIRPPEFLEIGDLLRVNFYRPKRVTLIMIQ